MERVTKPYAGVTSYADRHGRTRWRFRRGTFTAYLPGFPGDPNFEAAYLEALCGRKRVKPVKKTVKLMKKGTVYAMQSATAGGPVKIGFCRSTSLDRRLANIQTGSTAELRVVAQAPAFPRHESMAHAALASERVFGEWFEWSPKTRRFVETLGSGIEIALASLQSDVAVAN